MVIFPFSKDQEVGNGLQITNPGFDKQFVDVSWVIDPMHYPLKRVNRIDYVLIFSVILSKPQQHEPRLPIKVQISPIMTLIVLDKSEGDIPKLQRASMNQPIPLKGETEPNECLGQVCWLNTLYGDASFICQVI